MESWRYLGQPLREWPGWLLFRNYAAGHHRILIHTLEQTLIANIGDWIDITPDNRITVRRGHEDVRAASA